MEKILAQLAERYPVLEQTLPAVRQAAEKICRAFDAGKTLFVCGNGGSGADSEHIAGELLKSFCLKRPVTPEQRTALLRFGAEGELLANSLERGLRCISLLSHPGFGSAFGNDVDPHLVFAQQLFSLGKEGDVLLGISTSGNSENVRLAMIAAKSLGIGTVLLTGCNPGKCTPLADITVGVPERETYRIQELHLPVYHALCRMVEEHAFAGEEPR